MVVAVQLNSGIRECCIVSSPPPAKLEVTQKKRKRERERERVELLHRFTLTTKMSASRENYFLSRQKFLWKRDEILLHVRRHSNNPSHFIVHCKVNLNKVNELLNLLRTNWPLLPASLLIPVFIIGIRRREPLKGSA